MTWFESILLYSCFVLSLGCLLFSLLNNEPRKTRFWGLLCAGFLFLTLDERFALHERVRDAILSPRNIKLPIFFWTSAGDFILLLFAAAGILLLPRMIGLFSGRKSAKICFLTGVLFSAIAVILDSFNVEGFSIHIQRIEQFVEEILETTGMVFFLNALLLVFMDYLARLYTKATCRID
ncbi:MAG: hypothetical protein HPY66_0754 [Firmicutes bacterium]|nr:hypothetical protein [Bacillota bacterium]